MTEIDDNLWRQAWDLANHPYRFSIEQDEIGDGQVVFLARNSTLEGCKAYGNTEAEALTNLLDARADYFYALLKLGRPIPSSPQTYTQSPQNIVRYEIDGHGVVISETRSDSNGDDTADVDSNQSSLEVLF